MCYVIRNNFPSAKQTSETALLFLQLIMRRLKKPRSGNENGGRAAIVVPNGTLFGDDILAKERRIIEIMEEIKAEVAAGGKK